jgi:hypothetical protein
MTPLELIEPLGSFDLDPCASADNRLKIPKTYTIENDGLAAEWQGRVWLNPPYSNAAMWVRRLAEHSSLVIPICKTRGTTLVRPPLSLLMGQVTRTSCG